MRINFGSAGSLSIFRRRRFTSVSTLRTGDVRVFAPHALHERVAAEDDAAVAGQHVEQVELVRGQLDLAFVEPRLPARRFDQQRTGLHGRRVLAR